MAIGAATGKYGVYQIGRAGGQLTGIETVARTSAGILEFSGRVETIRRAEARYRIDPSPALLKELRANDAGADRLLTEVTALATLPETRQQLAATGANLVDHDRLVARYTTFSDAARAARQNLFHSGDVLSAVTKAMIGASDKNNGSLSEMAVKAEAAISLVGVANWRFIATADPKGPETFAAAVANAQAILNDIDRNAPPELRGLTAPVHAALAQYVAGFSSYA